MKSTYVIKIGLSKQFCSEKLLQIVKFTFQLLDLVGESDKELEKYSPLSIEHFSLTLFFLKFNFQISSISHFFAKAKFFFISTIYCRSVKFLKCNEYRIKTNIELP